MVIYSNIHLFKIPYHFISGINQLNTIKSDDEQWRYIAMDELWTIADSRMSRTNKNIFVANILAKSRKRHLTYVFTSQVADSIEGRVRRVLDFTFYPMLNIDNSIAKILVFRGGNVKKLSHYMKAFYYKTPFIQMLYDTDEEVQMEEESKEPLRPCFQENFNRKHGYLCECDECKTKFFTDWGACNDHASKFYSENINKIKPLIF
jgi:hypothetical protein